MRENGGHRRVTYMHDKAEESVLGTHSVDLLSFQVHTCACVYEFACKGGIGGHVWACVARGAQCLCACSLLVILCNVVHGWRSVLPQLTLIGDARLCCSTMQFVIHECPQATIRSFVEESARLIRPGGVLCIVDNNPQSKTIQNLPPPIFTLMKVSNFWGNQRSCLRDHLGPTVPHFHADGR